MSMRLEVALAVKALIAAALPGVDVVGLDSEDAAPDRLGAGGRADVDVGDPGRPEIDLSPLVYNYEHAIPVELSSYAVPANGDAPAMTAPQAVDAMIDKISDAIVANRFLGGLVNFLDADAPVAADDYVDDAPVAHVATLSIIASYATTKPL